jgi:hypothetical protein
MGDWITQLEAAGLRDVTIQVVNNWIRRGRVRTKEVYGKVLVSRSDVLSYTPLKPGPIPKAKGEISQVGKKGGKKCVKIG